MGKVFKYGENVDTDVIIPARHLLTTDPAELAKHCMEDIDADFADKVREGDIIVAGKNFGCGSSREHAPIAIKASGVSCVIAPTFARIFYRNSLNTGMPILESEEAVQKIDAGDEVEVNLKTGEIKNITKGETYQAEPFPEFIQGLIDNDGLVNYTNQKLKEDKISEEQSNEL
jgi:3-isopropylmalate dehydratase small subunit